MEEGELELFQDLITKIERRLEAKLEAKYEERLRAKEAECRELRRKLAKWEEDHDPIDMLASLVDNENNPRRQTFPVEPIRAKHKRKQLHAGDCPCCSSVIFRSL